MLMNIDCEVNGSKSKQKTLRSKASIIVSDFEQMLEACNKFIGWRNVSNANHSAYEQSQ